MRRMTLLTAAAAATLALVGAGSATAIAPINLDPRVDVFAAPLCQQQGGVFAFQLPAPVPVGSPPNPAVFSCTGVMTLFDLVKAKAVCSIIFHGTLATLPKVGPSILLAPNNGYKCSYILEGIVTPF